MCLCGDPGATRCAQWQAAILLLKNLRISQAGESSVDWEAEVKEPPWNTNQHFGAKEVRIIFDFTDPCCFTWTKTAQDVLTWVFFCTGNRLISIYSQKHWWSDYVIWINNFDQSFQVFFGGQNSSPMARTEGPAEFHCLLHRSAGMQQVVAVAGLKIVWCQTTTCVSHNRRHPPKTSKTPWRKWPVWLGFILRHVKKASYFVVFLLSRQWCNFYDSKQKEVVQY